MKMDIEFRSGDPMKPVVVFIHGLGMNRRIWTSPCEASILGGLSSLAFLFRVEPEKIRLFSMPSVEPHSISTGINPLEIKTPFHDLWESGYPVVTWSQRRPVGPLKEAVEELSGIISFASSITKKGIILIGHSRGGLVARKYLEGSSGENIKMLITISTPHRGSTMAGWVNYISPLAKIIEPFTDDSSKNMVRMALKRITDFLKSEAIKELMPDSLFMKSLKPLRNIRFISIAGTEPVLFSLWRWRYIHSKDGYHLVPDRIFSFPESILHVIPHGMIPDEWIPGRGDGLVSVRSAIPEDSTDSEIFGVNHARILIDRSLRTYIKSMIETLVD